jgi:dTDP-4-dehydrorhamnose reductase
MTFYCYFQKTFFKAADSLYNTFKETRPEVIVSLAGLAKVLPADE